MNISQNCTNLVKSSEGCVLSSYLDAVKVPTIGYGHTAGVRLGQKITQAQADAYLAQDLSKFAAGVSALIKVPVNQNQFDALVSFAYNLGVGALKTSTLLGYLNNKNYIGAANEFPKWVHAGGKVLPGLVTRRAAERSLFLTPVVTPKPFSKPASKPTAKPAAPTVVYHTVTRNETLSGIAMTFKTTIAALQKLNNIKNPNLIYAGQRLRIR